MSVFLSMSVLWKELQGFFVFLALFSIAPLFPFFSSPFSQVFFLFFFFFFPFFSFRVCHHLPQSRCGQ
jgi:hypothetical protein